DEELVKKLKNNYKSIIDNLTFDNDKKILNKLIDDKLKKTLLFLEYKKTINNENKIENLVKDNKNTLIYNIRNDININQLQKNILINNIIQEKINNSMNELYNELLILINKKTFFSIQKTNIVHLMLYKLDQKYLLNRDVNTIFKKFLPEELEDAIIDYDYKIKNLDSRTSKDLETQKKLEKINFRQSKHDFILR
ncbi:2872_t:CDS:1, partial [Cetraspora pellucida]